MTLSLHHGQRYWARLSLGFFEKLASNGTIRGKLEIAGFSAVQVTGSGSAREAWGTWSGPDQDAELPSQIAEVRPA